MVFTGVMAPPRVKPLRFGLFSAATVVEHGDSDEHWLGGFEYETESCNFLSTLRDPCQPELIDYVFDAQDQPRSFKANPFSINAIDKCSTFGFAETDRRARVMRQLELVTQKAVERELWGGTFADILSNENRFLASNAAEDVTPTGGAVSARTAVAILEGAMAGDCGPGVEGVIHMSRTAASLASSLYRQVPEDPNRLETMLGTAVAAGGGYSGAGPDGTVPTDGSSWIYATGPVKVDLGPKQLINARTAEALDIHVNDLIYQAERPAAVTWDGCCLFAVHVDLTA
jgi:hypothetical protein